MKRKISIAVITAALALLSAAASADEFHYKNLLIGDRASGMGGAYTAVSDDATGLYYNPAGIVYSSGRNLSASVNAYYNLTKEYDGVIAGRGWKRTSSSILPNYFGIVQPMGKLKFGFSYAVPDSVMEDQDQSFDNLPLTGGTPPASVSRYVINFNNQDTTYNFGPSIAGEISDKFAAGMTLYVYQKKRQAILNQIITLSDSRYEWTNWYYERNEFGLRPIIGIMWSPIERMSFGLSLSKVIILKSVTTEQTSFKDFGDGITPEPLVRTDIDSTVKRKQPIQVNAGIAYFASSDLLLSGDLNYFTKVDDPAFGNRVMVLNGSIGAEYYLSREWALRGGFYTDMANTPEIVAGTRSAEEKVDLYGLSMSISHFTRNTSVSLAGSMAFGSGKSQITSNLNNVQNADQQGWMIFLSSSYSY